jgi:glycosyltransferase involved in cell wall biosynthesis
MSDRLLVLLRGSGTTDLRRTTESLKEHTPGVDFRSLGGDSGSVDPLGPAEGVAAPVVHVIGPPEGAAENPDRLVWDLLDRAPDADVVLLQIGVAVGPHWHQRLRAVAYEDAIIATASAVPSDLLPAGTGRDGMGRPAAGSVASTALGEPLWGCVYVRRDALHVALAGRSAFTHPDAATSPRLEDVLLLPGLVHVLASTVVAAGNGRPRARDDGLATASVRRALTRLEAEVEPLRVTVDLRCAEYPWSGTNVHAFNLVARLARDHEISVLLPSYVDPSVRPHLDALPTSVKRLRADRPELPPPHVFHRPFQLFVEDDVTRALAPGTRLVVTHQDMILDRTPAYFPSKAAWRSQTAATALSLIVADEVAFFSEHARQEAVRDGLVDPAKTSVVPPGTDHLDHSSEGAIRPAELGAEEWPFILVLGHAYFHKNRVFALRVAEELRRRHAWEGGVVFAGGWPQDGSSVADENAFLADRPELRARFVDLGHVTDEEQRWLYRHAQLVVYPTLYEGFGLIPFEAAALGTACVYSSRSSVAEYLPAEGAIIDVADVVTTATRLAAVLEQADVRDAIVHAIRVAGEALTWDRAAASYTRVYRSAMERPVGLSLAADGDVVVTTRSQVPADLTEWRLLLLSRRFAPVKLLARALFGVVITFARVVHRDRAAR